MCMPHLATGRGICNCKNSSPYTADQLLITGHVVELIITCLTRVVVFTTVSGKIQQVSKFFLLHENCLKSNHVECRGGTRTVRDSSKGFWTEKFETCFFPNNFQRRNLAQLLPTLKS